MSDFSSMTCTELRDQCRSRNLPTSGRKAELVERLESAETEGSSEPKNPKKRRRSVSPSDERPSKRRALNDRTATEVDVNEGEEKDMSDDEEMQGYGIRPVNPTPEGEIKIVCYNLNGCRAAVKKGLLKYLMSENADVYCFNEMKSTEAQFEAPDGYQMIFNECTDKKGYAGTCVLTRMDPVSNSLGIGSVDGEGRAIIVEFEKFFLINTYVPNSGQNLKFKDRRLEWDEVMKEKLAELKANKPIIWTGDLNVAIEDCDVYDGETNKNRAKSAGFTPYERKNFRNLLEELDLIDSYRQLYPDSRKQGFTFWSNRVTKKGAPSAKDKNTGWRLDYFIVSQEISPLISDVQIRRSTDCSDHCPLVLTLKNPNEEL